MMNKMKRWIAASSALVIVTVATAQQSSFVTQESALSAHSGNAPKPTSLAIILIGVAGMVRLRQSNKI
jgi:hypothetical protein